MRSPSRFENELFGGGLLSSCVLTCRRHVCTGRSPPVSINSCTTACTSSPTRAPLRNDVSPREAGARTSCGGPAPPHRLVRLNWLRFCLISCCRLYSLLDRLHTGGTFIKVTTFGEFPVNCRKSDYSAAVLPNWSRASFLSLFGSSAGLLCKQVCERSLKGIRHRGQHKLVSGVSCLHGRWSQIYAIETGCPENYTNGDVVIKLLDV